MCRADYSEVMPPTRPWIPLACAALGAMVALGGCTAEPDRIYPLRGQILAIGAPGPDGRREATVKHDDIPTFMPAMTMPYFVRPPAVLDGLAPGDLITADIVIPGKRGDTYLANLKKSGHADLRAGARAVKIMDVMNP